MLTLITAFRDFDATFGPIQRSALFSYRANKLPVIAPDMEPSVADTCSTFKNIELIPGVKTAKELGFKNSSPVLKDMLQKCLSKIKTKYVGLINSDIILPPSFNKTCTEILKSIDEKAFIAVTRYDTTLYSELYSNESLATFFKQDATIYDECSSSDLFITSKKNFINIAGDMPEFILGRYAWDNWLHYYAAINLRPLNGTHSFKIRHCRHTHKHIIDQEGFPGKTAASSAYNIALLEDMQIKYGPTIRVNDWGKIL